MKCPPYGVVEYRTLSATVNLPILFPDLFWSGSANSQKLRANPKNNSSRWYRHALTLVSRASCSEFENSNPWEAKHEVQNHLSGCRHCANCGSDTSFCSSPRRLEL